MKRLDVLIPVTIEVPNEWTAEMIEKCLRDAVLTKNCVKKVHDIEVVYDSGFDEGNTGLLENLK